MGIKYSFVDNMLYGPEDINEIAGCLTGSGVMPFVSKDSYSTADLNAVTEAIVTQGTSLDGCKCIVENSGTADMCIKIAQGIIFFESGVRLVVDSDGYSVSAEPNTGGYIFAHYSPSLQVADIKFGTSLPDDGEYVQLAELKSDGTLKDIRSFAISKVATMGRTNPCVINQDRATSYSTFAYAPVCGKGKIFGKIDLSGIDISRYRYLLYKYRGVCEHISAEIIDRYIDLDDLPANFTLHGTRYVTSATVSKVAMEGNTLIFYTSGEYSNDNTIFNDRLEAFKEAKQHFVLV